MKTLEKYSASPTFRIAGKKLVTVGTALVCASAPAIAPTVQPPPPRPVPAVQLTAAVTPSVAQPTAQVSNVLGALLSLDLKQFIVPPSVGQPAPPLPTIPAPQSTGFEFEDLIINTYHAIEPWVEYGFEIATYAAGWVPWVGWLSPQIMIFYHFGEHIVESLVVNSANWLWGPLPFGEGLRNVARDSWDALVQLGIDQWNFWLPPLPPRPFTAQQAQAPLAAEESLTPAQQSAAPATGRPHPLRDAVAALRTAMSGPDANAPQRLTRQEKIAQRRALLHPAVVTDLGDPQAADNTPAERAAKAPDPAPRGAPKLFGQKSSSATDTSSKSPRLSKKSAAGTSKTSAAATDAPTKRAGKSNGNR